MKKTRWFIIFLITVAILGFADQGQKILQLNAEKEQYLQEAKSLSKEIKTLQEEVVMLEDTSYIEILARENLGMIYPNEVLFVEAREY